eukprot:15479106-Alexandrium_andersonii.AAC.1
MLDALMLDDVSRNANVAHLMHQVQRSSRPSHMPTTYAYDDYAPTSHSFLLGMGRTAARSRVDKGTRK